MFTGGFKTRNMYKTIADLHRCSQKKKKEFTDVGSSDEEESRNENRQERQKHLQTCENTTDVINKSVVVVVASKFH